MKMIIIFSLPSLSCNIMLGTLFMHYLQPQFCQFMQVCLGEKCCV